ncbi:MAG: glycosyltransferase family 2 protein [Flavisolibacter sp.]
METCDVSLTVPPKIKPCHLVIRPLWSVMIPVYNCADFLPETLQSVLQQAPEKKFMQIEVVDDASTDANVEELVHRIGLGRIQYYRQPKNVGSLANFVTCLNRSTGHYIHLLHGDDKVKDGYYHKMESLFNQYSEAGAAFCRYSYINEEGELLYHHEAEATHDGILENWLERIVERQRIQYCSIAVKRQVYENLGGFYGVSYGEDWEMWARIAANYAVAYTPAILSGYRIHLNSVSGRSFKNGQNMQDLRWVINTIEKHVLPERREEIKKKTNKFYAHYALRVANRLWKINHDKEAAKIQIHEAIKMHKDYSLYWKIFKLYTKMLANIS